MKMHILSGGLAVLLVCAPAMGVSFTEIRIGDFDGFGLGVGAGLTAANGGPVNLDGVGNLAATDFAPDWNTDGSTATNRGDDFDYRSAAEIAQNFLTGTVGGYVDVGTTGSHFTDIALSTSYDNSQAAGSVYIPPGLFTQGPGGPFPKPPSATRPNQPGFVFDFTVLNPDIS